MNKIYKGRRFRDGTTLVTVGIQPLDPRLDLANHSPTGLDWGYNGSGPAQLALALLADCAGDIDALNYYKLFKHDHVVHWDVAVWVFPQKILVDAVNEYKRSRTL